jgi:hypothetical protein
VIAVLLATLVHATPVPPRTDAPPPAISGGWIRSDGLLGWDRDEEELGATGLDVAWTGWATRERPAGWDEDDAGSFAAGDAEAAWDLASGEERQRDLDDRSAGVE